MSDTRERLRRFLIRAMSRAHGGVYRVSGGRLLGRVAGMPVLLLTAPERDRQTTHSRADVFRVGADLVVIGSFGGRTCRRPGGSTFSAIAGQAC